MKPEELTKLFYSQMHKLRHLDTPQAIRLPLLQKKKDVISKAIKIWIEKYPNETLDTLAEKGIYLIIPVIPRSYIGIYALIMMVRHGGEIGETYIDPERLTNVIETPKRPYYAIDVENGKAMLGKSPCDAEEIINRQNRSCLIVDEIISLGIFTKVLSTHTVYAIGSRYNLKDVPRLCMDNQTPSLDCYGTGLYTTENWGYGSCGSRF